MYIDEANRGVGARLSIQALIAISALIWIAYFHLCSRLGLYQDDVFMYHIVEATHDGVLREAFDLSRRYGGEGRPATQVFMVLLTWVGTQLGGITGLYVLGWILLTGVSVLVYSCLRQFFSASTSFLATAFYALFPSDAAKFFAVTYMADVGAMIFWGTALLLLKGRPFVASILLASSFLMSEAFILPGALLALLVLADPRRDFKLALRKAAQFLILYACIIVPAVILRLMFAPGRAAGALAQDNRLDQAKQILASMYFGVTASASSLYGRISEFFFAANSHALTMALVALTVLAAIAKRLSMKPATPAGLISSGLPQASNPRVRYIVGFGLLAWAASYPLYGIYPARFPPNILLGKLSNVHGQAAPGVTFLFAMALHGIESKTGISWHPALIARGLVSAYLAALVGFFVLVQERYVDNWHHQLSFWRQLPAVVPELKPTSLVVVETVGDESTRLEGGSSFDWSMPYLFRLMWQTPADWSQMPLLMTQGYYDSTARTTGDRVDISGYPTLAMRSFAVKDVVHLRVQSGRMARLDPAAAPPAGVPLYDESLIPSRFLPGPFLLRAAGISSITLTANDYSSNEWKRGVSYRQGTKSGTFYFILPAGQPNPVRMGDVLDFRGAGKAIAKRVEVAEQGSATAVFVTVDHELDPIRDGFPNPIHIRPGR